MRKQNGPFLHAAAGVLLCVLTTPSTQADIASGPIAIDIYPGETCIQWKGGGVPSYNNGSIGNSATAGPAAMGITLLNILYVDCPIIGRGVYELIGTGGGNFSSSHLSWGRVWVTDRHGGISTGDPTKDVLCAMLTVARLKTDSSIVFAASEKKSSSDMTSQVQWLDLGALPRVEPSDSMSHHYISCSIPPKDAGLVTQLHTFSVWQDKEPWQ